jgi:hypothetical protein
MLKGSILVALIFKIHYTAMFSSFASKHKYQSQKGEILLLQTDLSRSNTVVPKAIQWRDITLPDDWILEGATPPNIPDPPQPNVQIKDITQYTDGKVKLSFHRHSTSSRFSEESSSSSTINLGRISKIPSVINVPYHTNPPTHSTSDILLQASNKKITLYQNQYIPTRINNHHPHLQPFPQLLKISQMS